MPKSLITDWQDKQKDVRELIPEWKEFKWSRAD
jgi:hypothetical protein